MNGESFVATLGLASLCIVLAVSFGAAWITMNNSRDVAAQSSQTELDVTKQLLARTTESLLVNEDVSSLRRLLIETARTQNLKRCRLTLPDGRIFADADPTKINLATLPKHWLNAPLEPVTSTDPYSVSTPILIPGKGTVILRMQATEPAAAYSAQLPTSLGLLSACGIAALWLVYRFARQRSLLLGLIRESLLARLNGESSMDALTVSQNMGPEAVAWNQLLADVRNRRGTNVAERAKGVLGRKREGVSDLEQACDSLAVGLVIVDSSGKVRHANGAAANLLQVKRDELAGSELTAHVQDQTVRDAILTVSTSAGKRETIEWSREQNGHTSLLRVHVRPLRREDGSGSLVTLEDVTQQRVAEASRNSFVAQATHELRAPLTNMRLCLESVIDDAQSDPALMADAFNVINRESRRLERLVSEMLSVAEIEAGSMTLANDDVKIDRVFAELETDFRPFAAEKKITLNFQMPPKPPEFFADRDRLTLAIHNLIGNAIKYTPAGGSVMVTLHADDGRLSVDVADSGIGINQDELNLIFDRFYRAKDPRVANITGSGLGLALAREVARLHGGEITVQSELNKGSTFTLSVPLKAPPARKAA